MARWILASAAALAAVTLAAPTPLARGSQEAAPAPSPRNANYRITAVLDPAKNEIVATGRLNWRNISGKPVSELQFHLYWNAWRDSKSSWMREQALGRNRSLARRPADDFGGVDVSVMAVGGKNLAPSAKFIAPDDGNVDDRTVLSVPL